MAMHFGIVLGAILKLLGIAAAVLYAGMVLARYRTDGPRYRLNLEVRDPARSLEYLTEWLGVKALDACVMFGRALLSLLVEASAEVGEWLMQRKPALQANIRSRFLV